MKRMTKRMLALALCMTVLSALCPAAAAQNLDVAAPAYLRALSRLVSQTAHEGDFGDIQLTVGDAQMLVDGRPQPIGGGASCVPFIGADGEVRIPAQAVGEADLNGSGYLSREELEAKGYDVQTDGSTGSIRIADPYRQCRLIVKTADGKVRDAHGATQEIRVSGCKTVLQYADKASTANAAALFANDADVLFCVPDSICTVCAVRTQGACMSTGTQIVGADAFISSLPDDSRLVTVAVLDTGADTDHPFLEGRLAENGWDFVQDDADPDDDNGHGTHCAGILCDAADGSVRILPVKVLNANGSGSASVITEGMIWAADNGADLLSMSLGTRSKGSDALFADAVNTVLSKGVAVFAASGNDGVCLDTYPLYPASCAGVITVAATTAADTAASYSDYGSCVDLAAPGSDILSCVPGGGFASRSGTSAACPLAAACGALLKCADPSRTPEDLRAALCEGARDAHTPGRDDFVGSGIVYLGPYRPLKNMYCTQSELTLEPLADAGSAVEVVFEPAHPSDCALVFQSSDPDVALVSDTGMIRAVSGGTAVVTVRDAQARFTAQIRVTVTGDGTLRFRQVQGIPDSAMRFLRPDGTAYAYGFSDGAFGYDSASADSAPFRMCGGPGAPITQIARFLGESFFEKTDGSLWMIGQPPGSDRLYRAPIPLWLDAQTPMTGVADMRANIALRTDGSLWYLPAGGEPYFAPVCTLQGEPLTGIASLGSAIGPCTNGVPAVAEDGRAYLLQINTGTYAVTASPVADASGAPYTDARAVFLLKQRDRIVLHRDGTLTDKSDAVLLRDVQSAVCGWNGGNAITACYAIKTDGSVWDALAACAVGEADGDPLLDIVLLTFCQPNAYTMQFFAVRADGTVWAWGHNGVKKNANLYNNAQVYGSLGIGRDAGANAFLADADDVSCAYLYGEEPAASALWYDAAHPVCAADGTALTDVTNVCADGYTNFFFRSDGRVFCSGISGFSGYNASVLHTAVCAVPLTLLGQQVVVDADAESGSPYSPQPVRKITVSKPDMAATVGETFSLTASVFPQDTYARNIRWNSSDPDVAVVDGAGHVTARGEGVSFIRAYSTADSRVWGTCVLTVQTQSPASVTVRQYPAKRVFSTTDVFDPTDGMLTLHYADGQVRSIRISPDFCTGPDLTQTGEQTVTIRFCGSTFTYPVTVRTAGGTPAQDTQDEAVQTSPADTPYLLLWNRMPEKVLYTRGEALDVSGGAFFADSVYDEITLTPEMCSGFDPMHTGAQTVTVTYTGTQAFTATLTFDVFVTALCLENEAPQIEVGKCTRILGTFAPCDADGREIVWTSSDARVAAVDRYGKVTGIAAGTAEITACVKGSDVCTSCTVTVVPRTALRMAGDADCDGEVTLRDVVQITRFLAGGWNAVIDLANADVDGGDTVTLRDVVLLRRYLAGGWDAALQ